MRGDCDKSSRFFEAFHMSSIHENSNIYTVLLIDIRGITLTRKMVRRTKGRTDGRTDGRRFQTKIIVKK